MASLLFNRIVTRIGQKCQHPVGLLPALTCTQQRYMTHYPIDDIISGLSEEQIQVWLVFLFLIIYF